jgi:putative ABC transport system permease protein
MPLVLILAFRNLFHDRLRFIATVIGIVFSIVLVTVQMGLYLGFGRMVTTMIDHASADLWIMPQGTKCFEDPSLLDARERYRALSINGVAEAIPVVIGFADWRMPGGATTPVFVVGSDLRSGGLQPWNLVEGRIEALSTPEAVAVDRSISNGWHLGTGNRRNQQLVRSRSSPRHPFITTTPSSRTSIGRAPTPEFLRQGHRLSGSPEPHHRRLPSAVKSRRTSPMSRC